MVLDEILAHAAQQAGAELRAGVVVREVLMEGERVLGIRGEMRGGASVTERASLVIGADGLRFIVARAVNAPIYEDRPALCCAHYAYWADVPLEGAEFYVRDRRVVWAFPTNDALVLTFIEWPIDEGPLIRSRNSPRLAEKS